MLFQWLRNQVRNAVLAGIADAVAEVAPDNTTSDVDVLGLLRARLTPALPEPESPNSRKRAAKE